MKSRRAKTVPAPTNVVVRCPVAALVKGACTGCRYCEHLWEERQG